MKIGLLPIGRPTFDVDFAREKLASMLAVLETTAHTLLAPRDVLLDEEANGAALQLIKEQAPDLVLILQLTFTDAVFVIEVANNMDLPLAIWAPPEPRLGARLRLNAFCGLNLASHALGRNQKSFSYLYADPQSRDIATSLEELLAGKRTIIPKMGRKSNVPPVELPAKARHLRIARIGAHPNGFDTCRYDKSQLKALVGAQVDEMDLSDLFDRARQVPKDTVRRFTAKAQDQLENLGALDAGEVDRSLRLAAALDGLKSEGGYDAFAIRCWPEAFSEYGGAVCAPVSIMGEARVPCACEADVYGAVTQALLQNLTGQAVFLADLVDVDVSDNTGVVWHCGQAPVSMADPDEEMYATMHSNRKMALLYEFPLKPGRVTFLRLSQAYGKPKIILATGEMLSRPMAFTGTSGVVRFDNSASAILRDIMDSGLEHHMALAYGDHADGVCAMAAGLGLDIIILGENNE